MLSITQQACQSLRHRECEFAIAGGVNLILTPEWTITFSQAKMMSTNGRCKTFDADADGYVRGEGCGVVILKRLSQAVQDGDPILAVIKGSAVNQDGRSNGLTAPNGPAQQAVIRQALKNAGVTPTQISYVEAHGTGTSLGDPIEVNSLKEVLLPGREQEQPCWISSVKTNIGHLEGAAGIAGLIKVILALQHEEIPQHLHLNQLNPHIDLEGIPLSIPTTSQKWLRGDKRRLAGVSSFGFGGTNAHVIVDEAPVIERKEEIQHPQSHLFTLSAKNQKALQELAQNYQTFLTSHPEANITDICFTNNTGRSHFGHRLSIVTESTAKLCQQLSSFTTNQETVGLAGGIVDIRNQQKIGFLFTGQGSQYVEMGRELYQTQPIYRKIIDYCADILRPYLEKPLQSVLYPASGESSPLDQTAYAQPALFALEYALAEMWRSWGIEPAVVMGHSLGEYVAATIAGVLSLEDGLRLVAERGRLMQSLPQIGSMVAVFAPVDVVEAAIELYQVEVGIAAINGRASIVISGETQAVENICANLSTQGVKTKKLNVSHAFHSPLMQPILAEFRQILASVEFSTPRIGIISNLTGEQVTKQMTTPEYWCDHLCLAVRFTASLETLEQYGCDILLEIGPKPVLLGMIRQHLPELKVLSLPSLRPGVADWQQVLDSLAKLYVNGVFIDWSGVYRDGKFRRLQLPTYAFDRQRYWIEQKQQQKPFLSQGNTQTFVTQLLNQGNSQQLIQLLVKGGNFSEQQMQPIEVLESLIKLHQQQLQTASVSDLLYQLKWQPKPRLLKTMPNGTKAKTSSAWLIFADEGGFGEAVANLLRDQGEKCILVFTGPEFQKSNKGNWYIQPSNAADFARLFQEALKDINLPLRVIYLWSIDTEITSNFTNTFWQQAHNLGCNSVLTLVQALVRRTIAPSRLWIVTRGAMPVDISLPGVAQAPLWGLGKVIALETPHLWGGMIDLSPDGSLDEITMLLEEIRDAATEDHIGFRRGQRYVARLVRGLVPEIKKVSLQLNSSYLITGGLGALGLKVAQWLVTQGANNIILVGRNGVSGKAQEAIASMEQAGAKVTIAQADVSRHEDMVRLFAQIKASTVPLRGIIHAAGVLDDGILLQQNWERFSKVMAPKVEGAWNLHILSQDLPLDFFVCFSSAASLLGSPGQGNYAAANAFLDALAYHRQIQKLPGLSINWGQWADVGMAASVDSRHQARWATQGLGFIEAEQGLQLLDQLLGQTTSQVGILKVDWSLFTQQLVTDQQRSLFSEVVVLESSIEIQPVAVPQRELLQRLDSAQASDRWNILMTYIQEQVHIVLGLGASQLPDLKQGFFNMGMDSLMAVEFKNRLELSLGAALPPTLIFEFPTIKDIAEYIAQEVLGWKSTPMNNGGHPKPLNEQTTNRIEAQKLSENEVEALIAGELSELETLLTKN